MVDTNRRTGEETTRDERVASLLAAAAAPTEPGPAPGESEALAAYRAAYPGPVPRRPRRLSPLTSLRTATAAVAGAGVLVTGGVAAAVTGSLPDAAQQTAHDVLARVGVSVPGPDERSAGHAGERGSSGQAPDSQERDAGTQAQEGESGREISGLATDSTQDGVDKGAEISERASDGQSEAGQHGSAQAPGEPAGGDAGQAQVDTPNTGGEDRPDSAGSGDAAGSGGTEGSDQPDASGGSDDGASVDQGSSVELPDVAGDTAEGVGDALSPGAGTANAGGGQGASGLGNRP